jgi:hypothetical protein
MNQYIVITANILQLIIPFFSLIAYIPFWLVLLKLKSSKEISLLSWWLWLISASFALFYAIIQNYITNIGMALIFSTSLSLLFVIITIILIIIFR